MKKAIKLSLITLASALAILIIYMGISFPPIIAGMGAKVLCSCVFATGRAEESVRQEELSLFPLPLGSFQLNKEDSTAMGSCLGITRKAIYRKGLGCTLLAERTEAEVRTQRINLPPMLTFNPDTVDWPMGDRIVDSLRPEVNSEKIQAALDNAFLEKDPDHPVRTHAVIVLYRGQPIAERYAPGFDQNSPLMGWSMSKSVINALTGILVGDKKLDVDKEAPVDEWKNDDRKNINLGNLLRANSGLAWDESYFLPGDFHNMFIHSDDKGGYAAHKELEYKPGEFFEYSSGTSNLLSRIIRSSVGDSGYYRFPYTRLFHKTGMLHTFMECDASATFVGSSYTYASARDWARFGLLYLNDGLFNGERILPEGWVKFSSTPAPSSQKGEYGAQFWLNAGEKKNPSARRYPSLPADLYMAEGFEGQFVAIIPSENLVVVRLGVTHGTEFDLGQLVSGIMDAIKNKT